MDGPEDEPKHGLKDGLAGAEARLQAEQKAVPQAVL